MLARSGKAGPVVLFTRNRLCALVRADLELTEATLLDRLLDPEITLGISTPRADPSGDYAWEVFRRAEALRPGSQVRLKAKAGHSSAARRRPRRRRTGALMRNSSGPAGRRVPDILHERRPGRARTAERPGRAAARAASGRRTTG